MTRLIANRLASGIVVLWIISVAVFTLFFVAPNNVAQKIAGRQATPLTVVLVAKRLGLNRPILDQHGSFLWKLLHGNLGYSYYNSEPVLSLVGSRIGVTISLTLGGAVLWLLVGISTGVLAATHPRSLIDKGATFLAVFFYGAAAQARPTVHAEAASCLNSRWHPEVVPLADDSALTMRSTPVQPPQVVRLRRGTEPAPWTASNTGLAAARRMRVRELRWTGPGGLQIEGLLAEPATGGAAGGAGRRPLVVDIHGGPSLAWHHSWDLPWAELLTGAGYAVLMANPRGSAGRGQPFGRANLGDPAGAEFDDLLAGMAHCAAAGLADAGRVAAMGASYGGYLTAWAIAGGTGFRCGVVIAGISDLVSCRGTANNAPFYDYLLQGRPAALAPGTWTARR
jgi:Prolyl oligopeptidase family/Binding-prot-dependent transport system membrane comp, N-term